MSTSQQVDDCVIRWWRGYVKSCFFVVVIDDASSPDELTVIESPYFWSFRKSSLTPEGPIAAAHRQLVGRLAREGWQPAGVGELWYEQRFVRKGGARVADGEPVQESVAEVPALTPEPAPTPALPATEDDRGLRVVAERAASPATPPASAPASAKRSAPRQAGKRASTGSKTQPEARARQGTTAGRGPSPAKTTGARRSSRPPARATRAGARRTTRTTLRSTRVASAAVFVGWGILVAVGIAALLIVLTGS